jgi:hypothetical protein
MLPDVVTAPRDAAGYRPKYGRTNEVRTMYGRFAVPLLLGCMVTSALALDSVRVEAESFQPVPGAPAWEVVSHLRDPGAACPGGLSGGAALGSNEPTARMAATVDLPPTPHYVWVRRYADDRSQGMYPFTVEINGQASVMNQTEPRGPGYVWEFWGRVRGGRQEITLHDPGSWSVVADCLVFTPDLQATLDAAPPCAVTAAAADRRVAGQLVVEVELLARAGSNAAAAEPPAATVTVALQGESCSLTLPLTAAPLPLVPGTSCRLDSVPLNTRYLPGGDYDLVVIARANDATRTPAAALAGTLETAPPKTSRPPRTRVRPYRGRPLLVVDGQPQFGMAFIGPRLADVSQMGQAGIRFMNLGGGLPERRPDGTWDFRATDEAFLRLLAVEPRAYYFPRVFAGTRADLPQDERVHSVDAQGAVSIGPQPSFASETWLQDNEERYRALARYLVRCPYAERVIGLHLCAGDVGENFQWSLGGRHLDLSPAVQRAYAAWLRERYRTEKALQRAWHDPQASFANPRLPAVADLWTATTAGFRDPHRYAPDIDFMQFYNDLVANALLRFARAVKEGSGGRLLTGAFFGYTFGLHHWVYQTSGHLDTLAALRSPDLDFLASPCGYGERGPGGVSIYHQGVWASQNLHGKLFYGEADIRTHLCRPDSPQAAYRFADTAAQSIALLQREFGNCLTGGKTLWWFDMDGGWFDSPELLQAIGRMNAIGEQSLARPYRSVAEIAVVVDPASWLYKAPVPEFDKALAHSAIEAIARLGAPTDNYLLDDLDNPRLPSYKVYLFLNAFHLTPAQRCMIRRIVERDRATAIWVYAPGAVDENAADPALCEALTGIRLATDGATDAVVVDVGDRRLGNPAPAAKAPLWFAADPEAEVLGRLSANGQPGLVRKRLAHSTAVYSSAPLTDPAVLRDLVRAAGVHIYSVSGDAFYLDNRYFCLHAGEGGTRRVQFPGPVTATDLLTGQTQGPAPVVEINVPQYGTALYEYRTADSR